MDQQDSNCLSCFWGFSYCSVSSIAKAAAVKGILGYSEYLDVRKILQIFKLNIASKEELRLQSGLTSLSVRFHYMAVCCDLVFPSLCLWTQDVINPNLPTVKTWCLSHQRSKSCGREKKSHHHLIRDFFLCVAHKKHWRYYDNWTMHLKSDKSKPKEKREENKKLQVH